jgi:hypothetical protein
MRAVFLPNNILKLIRKEDRKALGKAGLTQGEIDDSIETKEELKHQKMLCAWLDRHEMPYFWSRSDKPTRSKLGTPDFCIVAGPRALVLEIKGPKGVLSPEQKEFARRLEGVDTPLHLSRSFQESLSIIKEWIKG